MKDALEIKCGGLKCDNPNCNYRDNNISINDYEKYVNSKCPKCGENLLTEADYKNIRLLLKIVKIGNKIFPKRKDDEEIASMSVKMDGSGKMDFDIKK